MFPSDGLNILQIAEAIKDWNLCPIRIEGDLNKPGCDIGFSKEVFAAKCAAFIRSGYPVLLIGQVGTDGLHAICAVGIRSHGNPPTIVSTEIQDSWIEHIYVHDDNIGPNVRMKISTGPTNEAVLELSPPNATAARHALNLPPHVYGPFVPYQIVVAVHNDLRTSPDTLHKEALRVGNAIRIARQTILATLGGVIVSARFILLADYLERELLTILGGNPNFLRKARLDLVEQVRPMSLHLGVVRIGDENSNPIMDVLYDTTDSDRNHPVFANVGYSQIAIPIRLLLGKIIDLGQAIDAF
jgi:hypothetical protein